MPRSVEEILKHGDQLADWFEAAKPNPIAGTAHDALMEVRDAALGRADAERRVALAVAAARREGTSWTLIGVFLGTSGEAVRQRYRHAPAGQS